MIDYFSRVPVRMRGIVRQLITMPGVVSAFGQNNNIVLFGDYRMDMLIHEVGHCLDAELGRPTSPSTVFSTTKPWLDAYTLDTVISDSYAQTSQQENLAQQTVIALFDVVVKGGLRTVQPSWTGLRHMFNTLQAFSGDILYPYGVCAGRLEPRYVDLKALALRLY
jgi:hypothetical protein